MFYNLKDILKNWFVFFFLWSVWLVIYLMVLLESAGVVGFAGKALFSADDAEQKPRSGAGWIRLLLFFSYTQPFLHDLQRNIMLCFIICNSFSSGVCFSSLRCVLFSWGLSFKDSKPLPFKCIFLLLPL